MFMPWNPMKVDIERWLKTKELEFAQKEKKNPKFTPHKYLNKYVFSDLHEVFFCEFMHLLQEWLLRLKRNHLTNQIRQLEWHLVEITELQQVNNKFMCAIYFWLDSIIAGLIIEFAVDTVKSYTTAENDIFKGPKGKYIISLYTSINILLYDIVVMTRESHNYTSLRAWRKGGSTDMSLRYGQGDGQGEV
jgi:hypothetical protein